MKNLLFNKLLNSNKRMLEEIGELKKDDWKVFVLEKTEGFKLSVTDKEIASELGIESFLMSQIENLEKNMADSQAIGDLKADINSHYSFCWHTASNYSWLFLAENEIENDFEEIPYLQFIVASKLLKLLFRASGSTETLRC